MRKQQIFTLAIFLVLLGCAATWPYPEYVLDREGGMLRAHDPKDDLPLKVCDPNEISKANCYVILRETYRALRKDYNDVKTRLEACEAGK